MIRHRLPTHLPAVTVAVNEFSFPAAVAGAGVIDAGRRGAPGPQQGREYLAFRLASDPTIKFPGAGISVTDPACTARVSPQTLLPWST